MFQRRIAEWFSYARLLGSVWPHLLVKNSREYKVRRKCFQAAWWPKVLQAPIGRRLLVISPHPDDESIGPGGLLWAHRGLSEIHILCLTNGEKGGQLSAKDFKKSKGAGFKKMAEIRRRELSGVARLLGAKSLTFLGLEDGSLPTEGEAVGRLAREVEKVNPDVVLLPWFLDKHPDHRSANLLYARACAERRGMVLGYEIWEPLEPNALLDISGKRFKGKLSMIDLYKSQLRTVDYTNLARTLGSFRAFYNPLNNKRKGMVEAYVSLPNSIYCKIAKNLSCPNAKDINIKNKEYI